MAAAVAHVVVPNEAVVLKAMDNIGCPNIWSPLPNIFDSSVIDIAKFAVEAYNVAVSGSFKYKNVAGGWYMELKEGHVLFHLHVEVTDCYGCDIKVEVVVSVSLNIFGDKIMKLESFKAIG